MGFKFERCSCRVVQQRTASLRVYLHRAQLAANVIGYTNAEGQGVAGIEAKFNSSLAGVDGSKTYERKAPQAARSRRGPVTRRTAAGRELPTDDQQGPAVIAQQQINASIKRNGRRKRRLSS